MARQYTNIIISAASLFIGCLLYVLFREDTYIGNIFSHLPFITALRIWVSPISCNCVKFYFGDFLWGLSLGFGLQVFFTSRTAEILLCGCVTFLCGLIWEYLQFCGIISGTGDFWDIVSYFCAGTICIIFNLRRENQ